MGVRALKRAVGVADDDAPTATNITTRQDSFMARFPRLDYDILYRLLRNAIHTQPELGCAQDKAGRFGRKADIKALG